MQNILTTLLEGEITIKGQFTWGSNYTFLAEVQHEDITLPAVYKPRKGEQPLWDFPAATLTHREVAAYLVSEALGWDLVPPTVYRRRGPIGPGSLQLYVEHDPEIHFFTLSAEDRQTLRPVAIFDILINNADRKGGHLLVSPDGHLWLIDHGICFHEEDKLRTVIWDFAGEAIPDDLLVIVGAFLEKLTPESELTLALADHLKPAEIGALRQRARSLLETRLFPAPPEDRRPYPWPPV
jgi:uncharacterized repeat protein (TIGR03843 family)